MDAGRDHGGGIDAARAVHGGARADWLDLSTGINPVPYPASDLPPDAWTALPDRDAADALLAAARAFWDVPNGAGIVAAPGASALIARLPDTLRHRETGPAPQACIPQPTYNEWRAAFPLPVGPDGQAGDPAAPVHVRVHPNNPDGALTPAGAIGGRPFTIIDESFCDTDPARSHIGLSDRPGVLIVKSFGKFWGLAGLRLGFAIGHPATLGLRTGPVNPPAPAGYACRDLAAALGPWPVAGPALAIGARALADHDWAAATRVRLARDAARLDALMTDHGARPAGGTTLFRLYEVADADALRDRLARRRIWTRTFPYSRRWIRFGLPGADRDWQRLAAALAR